jgi:hypothetical protein
MRISPAQARINQGQDLDARYAAFFRQLGFTSAQQTQFRELMLDLAGINRDGEARRAVVAAFAENPNFDLPDQYKIFDVLQARVQAEQQIEVSRVMGSAVGQWLERFRETLPVRPIADQLATVFSSSETPLTPAQEDRLVELMASNAHGTVDTVELLALNIEAVAAQAQGLLSPAQVEEFQQVAEHVKEQKKIEVEQRNTGTFTPAARRRLAGR